MKILGYKKGQSVLITHTILLSFIVFMIFLVASTFLALRQDFQAFATDSELSKVCLILKSGVEKLAIQTRYKPSTPAVNTIDLRLPERIADIKYVAKFEGSSIKISTLNPVFNSSCKVGFNATYRGFASGGLTQISFARNSTEDLIEMKSI